MMYWGMCGLMSLKASGTNGKNSIDECIQIRGRSMLRDTMSSQNKLMNFCSLHQCILLRTVIPNKRPNKHYYYYYYYYYYNTDKNQSFHYENLKICFKINLCQFDGLQKLQYQNKSVRISLIAAIGYDTISS